MVPKSILYLIALVLLLGWIIGVFWFKDKGMLIHLLLALSVISAAIAFFRKVEED